MAKDKFEEMFDRLPSNIKETEVLWDESKKVLAALLELLLHSEARESKIIYAPNSRLRKLSGIDNGKLRPSIDQLIDYDLISRKVGKPRIEGEKSEASEYIINFKKLKEPIIEKSFDDLFSDFFEDGESLEMPINTAITTATTTSISTSTTISSSTSIETSTINSAENRNSLQEQNQEELEIIDSEENNLSESQLVSNEIPMEVLISTNELDSLNDHTDADKSSTINEGTNDDEVINTDEESYVPTPEEKETLKKYFKLVSPYLVKFQSAKTEMELKTIKRQWIQYATDYINTDSNLTDWVCIETDKRVKEYFDSRLSEIKENHQEAINRQLQQSSRFAAFC